MRFRLLILAVLAKLATAPGGVAGEVLITEARLAQIRERLTAGHEPTGAYFQSLMNAVAVYRDAPTREPAQWHVPAFYQDPAGSREAKTRLVHDTTAAYSLALAYRITGDESHAANSARYIMAWVKNVQYQSTADDTQLTFSCTYPGMIYAADLIGPAPGSAWPTEDRRRFATFLGSTALSMNTASRGNNWGNWGNLLRIAIAAYLDDDALFDTSVARYKEFVRDQIGASDQLIHEVKRNGVVGDQGIGYSHFTLGPQVMAAEIAMVRGVNLYDYVAANGRGLEPVWRKVAQWTHAPETFPYFTGGDIARMSNVTVTDHDYLDIVRTGLFPIRMGYFELLNARWPVAEAEEVLAELGPNGTDIAAMQFLGLTHGAQADPASPRSAPGKIGQN